jgi:hypothetical protein
MNVKITYSVPLEKIPSKIQGLIKEALTELENTSSTLKPFSSSIDNDMIKSLDDIEKTRKKLAEVDFLLEDCYAILAGYNRTIAELKMPKEELNGERPNNDQ